MNEDLESWMYFDGPEPEPVREMLDLLRELPPATDDDVVSMERALFAGLDAKLFGIPAAPPVQEEAPAPPPPRVRPLRRAEPDPEDAAPGGLAEPPPPLPVPPAAALASAGVPAALASTSLEMHLKPLPERISLPYKDPNDPRLPKPVAKTDAIPVYPHPKMGETLPLGDTSFASAVAAALPFAASAPKDGPILEDGPTLGGMTRLQYASFRAELLVWPEREAITLAEYHVATPEQRAVLEHLWQQHLARNPQTRATFQHDLARFTALLRGLRQNGQLPPRS